MLSNTKRKSHHKVVTPKKRQSLKKYKNQAYSYYEDALKKISNFKLASKKLDSAKQNILNALSLNAIDTDSLNLLSRIELERGDNKSALEAINSAIELEPNDGGYWYSAGHILLANHQLKKAKSTFENAIKLSPDETRAEIGLAYTYQELNEPVLAFQMYRELIKSHPDDQQLRSQLLNAAHTLKADYYDQVLERDLLTFLQWKNINLSQLSNLCCSLLEHKFQLNKGGSAAQFEEMANSQLFQHSLRNTLIKSELIEKLIMALRYELLIHSTKSGNLSHNYIDLSNAIAQYGLKSEFILPVTDAEKNMVSALKRLIEQSLEKHGCTPTDISGALLLFAMYEPWVKLNNYDLLSHFPDESWPSMTFNLKNDNQALFSLEKEKIDAVTEIPYKGFHSVKSQYESFPYPRWEKLDHKKPTNYGSALHNVFPEIEFSNSLFEDTLNILVAGCGTGRHALNVAKYFNNVNVTAIDISQKSLSFAKNKANEFDIKNIQFKLADLTQLESLDLKYDIIECSGVLHHIPEFKLALSNLLKNLKPNGLIKISLYSEYARNPVNQIRELFKRDIEKINTHKIKIIRQAILRGEIIDDVSSIINSDDFYSMSGIIDLLFHQFEYQFTPLKLKALCDEFQLEWIGFSNLKESVKSEFFEFHKENKADLSNVDQWEVFEQAKPNTFSDMYQFYCQYKPKLILN